MKKVVVSLLVVMMALAFSMTGVVSAQCPATTTTTACPATTTAQCTSTATSACCTPCPPVTCPVVCCPTTPATVVSCVVGTKCVFETVAVKEEVKPAIKKEAEKIIAEFEKGQTSKGSVESPQTVVDNKAKQSNTASQTATININTGKNSEWDGDVYIDQNQDQSNSVSTTVDNTNIDKTVNISNVNIKSGNTIDSGNNIIEVEDNTVGPTG